MKEAIYFIAILPAHEIRQEVKAFKEYALEHFESGRALRSPAHITLEPPFKWADDQVEVVEACLESFSRNKAPFSIELCDFDAFSPRVIFVAVKENEALIRLQKELKQALKDQLSLISDRPEYPFHPHMTVAFKDLKKKQFPRAWEYFSNIPYRKTFEAQQLTLLRHNGEVWEVKKSFFFGASS